MRNKTKEFIKQEYIPVGCILPTHYRVGVSLTETPLDIDPLDRDLLDRDTPRTETPPVDRKTSFVVSNKTLLCH